MFNDSLQDISQVYIPFVPLILLLLIFIYPCILLVTSCKDQYSKFFAMNFEIKLIILQNASEIRASYTALKEGKVKLPIPSPQQNKEIQQFYQKIKNNHKIKNSKLTAPATNYCQMLQEISEVQRFEVSYMDIAEISTKGKITRYLDHFFKIKIHMVQ